MTKRWMIAALGASATAILLDSLNVIDYRLSMKFLRYDHFVLDLIIPLSFTVVLVGCFQFITSRLSLNWLQKIEKHSLSIMYLHIFADIILNDYFTYGLIGFTAIGIFIPIIVSIVINKLLPNGKILLGGFSPKKKRHQYRRKSWTSEVQLFDCLSRAKRGGGGGGGVHSSFHLDEYFYNFASFQEAYRPKLHTLSHSNEAHQP